MGMMADSIYICPIGRENEMRIQSESLLKSGGKKLIAYWANNRGRGDNNCTLFVVSSDTMRRGDVAHQKKMPYLAYSQTSSWAGNVNISKRICQKLGIEQKDIQLISPNLLTPEQVKEHRGKMKKMKLAVDQAMREMVQNYNIEKNAKKE
jgi:hypothetical protein